MAFSYKVGSFAGATATGNQATTGVGFTPKAVWFWGNTRTADGADAASESENRGWAVSSTSRAAIANAQGGTSQTRHDNTKCVVLINNAGTVLRAADLVTLDSDGFTVNWTTANATQHIINYIAFGGADLTNVFIKQFNSATATGNQVVTGVGFKPDAVCFFGIASGTAPPATIAGNSSYNHGCATGATSRWATGEGVNGSNAGYQRSVKCYAATDGNAAVVHEADFVSFDTDGFTINWSTAAAAARIIWAFSFKGGQYKAANFNEATATGNQVVTGTGFTPTGLTLLSFDAVAATTVDSTTQAMRIGAASSTTSRGTTWNKASTNSMNELDRTKVTTSYSDAATPLVLAAADLVSFDSNGFTITWSTKDATARELLYFVVGNAAAAAFQPDEDSWLPPMPWPVEPNISVW